MKKITCIACGKESLVRNEIGINKKLLGESIAHFYCLDCLAEYLEVTEEFLEECIECYRNKYGICKRVDNYVVYFIPQLSVMKLV